MPVISNDRLKEKVRVGKVQFGNMPEIKMPKVQPPEPDRQLEMLEQIHRALVELSGKEAPVIEQPDNGLGDILKSIESLLKQMAKPKPKKKTDYEFNIVRDLDGNITKVEAKAK